MQKASHGRHRTHADPHSSSLHNQTRLAEYKTLGYTFNLKVGGSPLRLSIALGVEDPCARVHNDSSVIV